MVADEVEKGIRFHEVARRINRVAVSERLRLRNKTDLRAISSQSFSITVLVAGPNDDTDGVHVRGEGFLDEDGEDRFLFPVGVDDSLQRQHPLIGAGGSDESFL